MVPDKFNMVDMEGIDIIQSQGLEVPGLYQKLVESIAQCRYSCLYNWIFDGISIPPTFVVLTVGDNDEVIINGGVTVTDDDIVHVHSLEILIPPVTQELSVTENGTYENPDIDGYMPVNVDVPDPTLSILNVITNGEYTPDQGVYGFSKVIVNVPSSQPLPHPPSTYQEVEYIGFSGTQYTEVQNSAVVKDLIFLEYLVGTSAPVNTEQDFCGIASGNNWAFYYDNGRLTAYGGLTGIQIQSPVTKETKYIACAQHSTNPPSTFLIGRYRTSGSTYPLQDEKIYGIYITDVDGIISRTYKHYFVPCYRKSDNVAGFYDCINDVFYTNLGTGDFIVGPDKN